MICETRVVTRRIARLAAILIVLMVLGPLAGAQSKSPAAKSPKTPPRPKLVVLLIVDQMRADYVDKFRGQWTGGLKRLVEEGAWFRDAAYPYAATETCAGHATISTGALPATHGMIANAWWDRKEQKMVTCTSDPEPNMKNIGYAGATPKGADTAWRMEVPSFAEELKFQTSGATRIVTFSLKARAAITMAGHKADAVTWFDSGAWVTSSPYGTQPFIEEQARSHPAKADFGKTWSLSLPETAYWYGKKALGAVPPDGWGLTFPHPLRGKTGIGEPDNTFYEQWASSPYADTALTELAEKAVDALKLGNSNGTDFLAVSYSSVDYVGHEFGPRGRAHRRQRHLLCAWRLRKVGSRFERHERGPRCHSSRTRRSRRLSRRRIARPPRHAKPYAPGLLLQLFSRPQRRSIHPAKVLLALGRHSPRKAPLLRHRPRRPLQLRSARPRSPDGLRHPTRPILSTHHPRRHRPNLRRPLRHHPSLPRRSHPRRIFEEVGTPAFTTA